MNAAYIPLKRQTVSKEVQHSRRKEQFQNEESLEHLLASIFGIYNQKILNRSHKGPQQVTDALASIFTE